MKFGRPVEPVEGLARFVFPIDELASLPAKLAAPP